MGGGVSLYQDYVCWRLPMAQYFATLQILAKANWPWCSCGVTPLSLGFQSKESTCFALESDLLCFFVR